MILLSRIRKCVSVVMQLMHSELFVFFDEQADLGVVESGK